MAHNRLRVWRNARLATLDPMLPGLGIIESGAVAVEGGRIAFVGSDTEVPAAFSQTAEIIDCQERWILPGLIDCHTHLVYAGNRAGEFEQRLAGASYEEISRAGGGIASSVRALRAASDDTLLRESLRRLDSLIAEGVTTIEVKSGYGLDVQNETKSLRVARRLAEERPVTVRTTFLGAHAMPAEFAGDADAYIDNVANEQLPAVARQGLADAVDAFCETIAFSPDQVSRLFTAANTHGLPVKLHADQLSNLHGARLAASFGALSADHLEYADEDGVMAMASAGTVAVMLPGAFYFIHEKQRPPIDAFRRHGVPMAVATDSNPGTSPLTSILLAMNMAATLFGMTVDECIAGVTREAAAALGVSALAGTLERGKRADLSIWDIDRPVDLVYQMGHNPLHQRVYGGA